MGVGSGGGEAGGPCPLDFYTYMDFHTWYSNQAAAKTIDRGLIVLFFGIFANFRSFFRCLPPGNFSADALENTTSELVDFFFTSLIPLMLNFKEESCAMWIPTFWIFWSDSPRKMNPDLTDYEVDALTKGRLKQFEKICPFINRAGARASADNFPRGVRGNEKKTEN